MSTSRQRCGSWLAWAVALAAGCAGGGKAGEGPDAADDTAPVDCAASPLDCDGEDNDCDGMADEGGEHDARQLWGVDEDADGYPAAAPTLACAGAPSERVVTEAEALDCDDARSEAHPGAVEDCAAAGDEDCDALADCADRDCPPADCAELCDDGIDNDRDRWVDCADRDCWGAGCAEDCAQRGDEDGNGVEGCADPVCWGPTCAEDCRTLGDEDADGLADCGDADCVEACVEDCDDLFDNDMDGAEDCADLDCISQPRCWPELELHTPGPVSLRRFRWWDSFELTTSAQVFALQVPTLSIVGRRMTVEGGSASCTLAAHEVSVTWRRNTYPPWWSSLNWEDAGAVGASVDPPSGGCPPLDPMALIEDQLRLGGYRDEWFRTVVIVDVGRSWALDGLTIGHPSRSTGVISRDVELSPSIWTWGRWERSSTTATAVGFVPLP
ncbi:MAG: hypothetical protein RL071_3793 [Pseudomonadota bacterium]|jgi:hypothetical protein